MEEKIRLFLDFDDLKNKKMIYWDQYVGAYITIKNENIKFKIISYNNKNQSLIINYNDQNFSLCASSLMNSKNIKKTFYSKIFHYKEHEIINDHNRNLTIMQRFDTPKRYLVRCNKCNYEDVVNECVLDNHNYSCSLCNGNTVVVGKNDITTTDSWMIKYFIGKEQEAMCYTSWSSSELRFICPECNCVSDRYRSISQLKANRYLPCACRDGISYPEKLMRNILIEQKIDFIYQADKNILSWADKYRYDFYFQDNNTILEMNGEQHYKNSFLNTDINKQIETDKLKKELAIKNGIKNYIQINCEKSTLDYIKNNIEKSDLYSILNINSNNINYNKCDELSTKNIVKQVCDYYKNNECLLPKDLTSIFILSEDTIRKYLHIGNRFGWCNYQPKINLINGQIKTSTYMTNKKRKIYGDIIVYEESGIEVGRFINQYDAQKKLKDMGYIFSVSSIGNALKKENHKSKNLYFYYENEL